MQKIEDMSREDIENEISWNEESFERCSEIGQGISSKEVVRQARLKAELVMTGHGSPLLTRQQIAILSMEYDRIQTIDPCQPSYGKLCATLDAMSDAMLRQIAGAEIKFMSLLALNRCTRRGI